MTLFKLKPQLISPNEIQFTVWQGDNFVTCTGTITLDYNFDEETKMAIYKKYMNDDVLQMIYEETFKTISQRERDMK